MSFEAVEHDIGEVIDFSAAEPVSWPLNPESLSVGKHCIIKLDVDHEDSKDVYQYYVLEPCLEDGAALTGLLYAAKERFSFDNLDKKLTYTTRAYAVCLKVGEISVSWVQLHGGNALSFTGVVDEVRTAQCGKYSDKKKEAYLRNCRQLFLRRRNSAPLTPINHLDKNKTRGSLDKRQEVVETDYL